MKILVTPELFAREPMVRIEYGKEGLFFAGTAPTLPCMIALDFPGLTAHKAEAIRTWLVEDHRKRAGDAASIRREDTRLTTDHWRIAVLDDFLDAHNATQLVWHISTYFTLAQIATFAETHGPALHGEIAAALEVARAKRPAALRKVHKRAERIVPVVGAADRRLSVEIRAQEMELDREDVKVLVTKPFYVTTWIEACARLRSDEVKRELIASIAERLIATKADLAAALGLMLTRKLDTVYCPELWTVLTPHLVLPQNVTGESLDLTKAREIPVAASWELWKARRVGPVKIGRTALYVYDGKRLTYVRGERKLKHRIKARGGSIQRWGNTMTIAAKDPSSVHAALLRVDEIDSLAQLDPTRAVALLTTPPGASDPIANALAHALTEPRWRRILADLLIERLVGIDADVARRLARAEARANRR